MIGWLEDKLIGRQFGWGGGNAQWDRTVFGRFHVQRGQYGASLRWDVDEAARHAIAKLGPVLLDVTVCRRRVIPDWADDAGCSTLRTRQLEHGRELHTWRDWHHLGLTVEVDRRIRAWRVEAGPFGVCAADAA